MSASTINAVMAEMDPEEIRLIPRFMDAWPRAGWMDEAEAADWPLGTLAWAEFHRITEETDAN